MDICIKDEDSWAPVELLPLDKFACKLEFPTTQRTSCDIVYLDGYLIRAAKCNCPFEVLWNQGCQCGGV